MNKGLNIFYLLLLAPLLLLIGYVNLLKPTSKYYKFVHHKYMSLSIMLLGVAVLITHTILLVNNRRSGFMIGPNRLLDDQYDVMRLYTTNGDYKEGFIAENLPLWTDN